jgi:hypothetical protein
MHKQPGCVEVNIAGKIQVVNLDPLENGRLLWADVRRQQQQAIQGMPGWESRSKPFELVGDHGDVLMAEVAFFLYKIPNGPATGFPRDDPVEGGVGNGENAELRLRHPLLERGTICLKLRDPLGNWHVRNIIVFINNEHKLFENDGPPCLNPG